MEKIRNFISSISAKLEEKIGLLDAMFYKFQNLMAPNNHQLRIANSNQRILANEPVYNSPDATLKIKQAIETRTLQGLTPEQFESAYLEILHGDFSGVIMPEAADKVQPADNQPESISVEEPQPGSGEVMAIVQAQNLDIVPVAIDRLICLQAGHTEKYLLQKSREYNLTLRQLLTLLDLKNEYKTNLPTLLALHDHNLDLAEIEMILQTRAILQEAENNFTIIQLLAFHKHFADLPLEANFLADSILEACQILIQCNPAYENTFPDIKLKILMGIAFNLKTVYLECVLDWLNYCEKQAAEKGPHEYPDPRHSNEGEDKKHPPTPWDHKPLANPEGQGSEKDSEEDDDPEDEDEDEETLTEEITEEEEGFTDEKQ